MKKYEPFDHLGYIEKMKQDVFELYKKDIEDEFDNMPSLDYEDSIFKDMADDIISSQKEIEQKIEIMRSENEESNRKSTRLVIWTLVIAVLTLIATVFGIIVQFFQ